MRLPKRWIWPSPIIGAIFGIADGAAGHLHYIPIPSSAMAGPWLSLAFGVGALQVRRAAAAMAGVLALAAGLGGYYGWMLLVEHPAWAYLNEEFVRWLPIAIISGAIFGYAGAVWRNGGYRNSAAAGALLVGVLAAEAAAHLVSSSGQSIGLDSVMIVYYLELVVAVILPILLIKHWRQRATCYMCALTISLLLLTAAPVLRSNFWIF